jgi:hypothetical protein
MPTQLEIQQIVDKQNGVVFEPKRRNYYETYSKLLPPKNNGYKSSQSSSAKII